MAIEIVDFPINSMVVFHSYVKLPEGNSYEWWNFSDQWWFMNIPKQLDW